MDNDEILNVRWATEDPNPTTQQIEKRRLEEIGTATISAKVDPRMVDAVQSIRALEEGDVLVEDLPPDAPEEPPSKRRRVESSPEPEPAEEQAPPANSLLSAETLQGIKALAEMRSKHGGKPMATQKKGLAALASYGSEEDDE